MNAVTACSVQGDIPIHMHIMTTEVQRDKELEGYGIFGIGQRQIAQQRRCRAPSRVLVSGAQSMNGRGTHLSVTMSSTAPNLEVWFSARAA